ncbi:MAG: MFS transporter [Pseudomonadota bacterium]
MPIYPLYAVMFGDYGVSPLGLAILFSAWSGIALLVEIPSGALADRYSRKTLLVFAELIKATAFITWLWWPSFWGFMLGFALWGIAGAIHSGTAEALLYDALKQHNREDEFARIYGRGMSLNRIGVSLSMFAGGWLIAQYDYALLLQISVFMLVVASLVVMFAFYDPPRAESVYESGYLDTLKTGLQESVRNYRVLFVILCSASLLTLPGMYDEFISPVFAESGYSLDTIAYLYAVIFLVQAGGMALAHKLQHFSLSAMFLLMFIAGAVLLSTHAGWLAWVAIAMMIYFAITATVEILMQNRLQQNIESDSRATVTSTSGVAQGSSSIGFYMVFGVVAAQYDLAAGTIAVALGTLGFVAVFVVLARVWRV